MSDTKVIVNTYGAENVPAASDFRRGATTPAEFQEAVDAPRDQAEAITEADLASRPR